MEVAMETGTLKELNVKPGDVVECVDHGVTDDHLTEGKYYGIVIGPMIRTDMGSWWGDGHMAETPFPILAKFRIISRAAQATPTPDLTAITTPFGLLDEETQEALRAHGGPYERYYGEGWQIFESDDFSHDRTYRAKATPVFETVSESMRMDKWGQIGPAGPTKINVTFNRINGVIDLASYKVEPR